MIDWHTVIFAVAMLLLGVTAVAGTWWAERPSRKFWEDWNKQ